MTSNRYSRLRKFILGDQNVHQRVTYSQWAEDILVLKAFETIFNIRTGTYLDIGANDPTILNNTWLLYSSGWTGALVEPNPELVQKIKNKRPKDKVLNVGISETTSKLSLTVFDNHTLSTFSEEEALFYDKQGYKRSNSYEVECISINELIEANFDSTPNFISIDIEGNEFEILSKLDFSKYKPEIFCIETYSWAKDERDLRITSLFQEQGYTILAETPVNTIFYNKPA